MAENSQAVIPDNLIIVDGEIGGVPSSSASDAGKVLAVDSNGDPSWVTPSGGTLYTEGNGIDISDENVVSIDTTVVATKSDLSGLQGELTAGTGIDITNDTISVDTSVIATQNDISGLQPTLTAGDNISISNNTISATDTTYTAGTGLSLTGTEFAVDTTVIATQNDLPSSDELLPSATSSDEGKVLTIDSQGEAGWATPASVDEVPAVTSNDDGKVLKATYSGGVGSYAWATESGGGGSYTAGTGIDISAQNEISVDTTVVATQTDIGNVRQVPASTSADEDKVLTVNSSGNAVWAAAQGSSYTFSNPIKNTSGTVSLDYDTDTLSASTTAWTQFDRFDSSASGDAKFRARSGGMLAEVLNFGQPYSTISLHIPGNTYFSQNYASSKSYFISLSTDPYLATSTDRTITYIGHPLATEEVTLYGSTRTAVAEQDVVINFADLSDTSLWTPKQFNFRDEIYLGLVIADTSTTSPANEPLISVDDAETVPVKYKATVAAPLTIKNPLPASTSADEDKVLTVNASGNPVWATAQGGTTYTAGNMISLANDAVAVSTTAGITDIQLVNALPASPVATVLYLIPET